VQDKTLPQTPGGVAAPPRQCGPPAAVPESWTTDWAAAAQVTCAHTPHTSKLQQDGGKTNSFWPANQAPSGHLAGCWNCIQHAAPNHPSIRLSFISLQPPIKLNLLLGLCKTANLLHI
jgi:hypothetical protein